MPRALFWSALLASVAVGQQDAVESVSYSAQAGGHVIEATLTSRSFDSTRHKIALPPRESNDSARIDGKIPIGTDGTADAVREFSRFDVRFDGRSVAIPSALYADCFNPNLKRMEGWWDREGSVYFHAAEDGLSLLIQMHGSDAAGSYFATWVIARDGKHSRFIDQDGP